MARGGLKMGLALVLMTVMWACSSAQPSCPPAIVSLQPCLTFITSNSSTPPPQCCTQLASMVQTQAQCLCTFLNTAPPLPFNINRTQAIALPGACNIQAPPLSQCNAPSGPLVPAAPSGPFVPAAPSGPFVPAAPSPQEAPAPASPVTPSVATAPSPSSPAAPSTPSAVPSTPTTKGVPPAPGGSKAGPNKGQQSSSARSSTILTPSLFFFLLVASAFSRL